MPRIAAPTVAEHVARQQAAIFAAAIRLFAERGYANVGLGDIAAEVGLARNSLYRYYPDKAHILASWLRRELPTRAAESARLLDGDGRPADRVHRWFDARLDYARTAEHSLIAALGEVIGELDPETRAELAESHGRVLAPLDRTLAEAGAADAAERDGLVELIGALVMAVAQREARTGTDPQARRHAHAAVDALLPPTTPAGR